MTDTLDLIAYAVPAATPMYVAVPSRPRRTAAGTPYLVQPGVALIGQTVSSLQPAADFINGFDEFRGTADDPGYLEDPDALQPADQLVKFSGQLCYMALGRGRTKNKDASRYFANLREQGHGSVLEHASFSFLVSGCPRDFTHEVVRHRSGVGVSQVSQRYVDGRVLRFVERPEYQQDASLHDRFCQRIDRAAAEYKELTELLLARQVAGDAQLTAERRTDARKRVQQAARSVLPNETEAPIVITANVRAWRHIIEMRASPHADRPIRDVAVAVLRCLQRVTTLFDDHELYGLPDGTQAVRTPTRKV